MTLDRRRGAGPGVQGTPRLDDVRVEGPLNEEAHLAGRARLLEDLTGSLLEDPDELTADDLALLLRVGDAGESVHEAVGRVHDLELPPGDGDEIALDLFGLPRPQQAGVDEDAGQLIADGALHERGGHRRVDPAGQAADHAGVAHLRAYPLTCSSMTLPVVQSGSMPAPRMRKLTSTCCPNVECRTSGCHCRPNSRRSRCSNAATGVPGVPATTVNPSGAASTLSPWLIHTDCCVGWPCNRTDSSGRASTDVPPYSRKPVWATSPPSACAIAWNP